MMSSLSDTEDCVWCTAFHSFSTGCEVKSQNISWGVW